MGKLPKISQGAIRRKLNPFSNRFEIARHWCDFYKSLWFKRPYFGSVMSAGQLNPTRKEVMQRFLKKEILKRKDLSQPAQGQKPAFRILEVGSWAGGSCVAWCETARQIDCPLVVYCVDPWEWYEQYLSLDPGSHYRTMENALATDRIFSLFLHNISVLGFRDNVRIMRGYSSEILPILRPESFDFVYIDGNHSYSYVVNDIKNAKCLVRTAGVVCGDDAELLFTEIDGAFCRINAERDFVACPRTHENYHPGVTLAIHEEFNDDVFRVNGFWAVEKTHDNHFTASTW
jgi:hypothetical protein